MDPCSQPEWLHPCGCFAPTLYVHIRRSWSHFRPGGPLNRCQEKVLYAAIYKRGLAKHASVDIIKEVEVAMASTLFSEVFLQTLKVHVEREIVADGVFFFFLSETMPWPPLGLILSTHGNLNHYAILYVSSKFLIMSFSLVL